jgi:hypothetical protein
MSLQRTTFFLTEERGFSFRQKKSALRVIQRELTTAQDLNFIILPIFRKKSIMNPATL